MLNFGDPEVFWLNITNISLGVITLICVLVVGFVIFQEIAAKMLKRAAIPAHSDDHAYLIPELGLTMADGGEPCGKNSRTETH
jgi:hypothetical protein